MTLHTYSTEIDLSRETDLVDTEDMVYDVIVSFTFTPGCAAWGGSRFEPPINPPEDATIEDITLEKVNGNPRPWFLTEEQDDAFEAKVVGIIEGDLDPLYARAGDDHAYDADQAADARADRQLIDKNNF